jgi:adenosine deaminase
MQSEQALVRVAAEAAEDLAADGVVYAEVRYAPELFEPSGLPIERIVEAVQEGFRLGERNTGNKIRIGTLLCAMRQNEGWLRIAELAVRYRDAGVVGFDIAGPEAGFPPTRGLDAFEYLRQQNAHFTIHAGEAFGLPSPTAPSTSDGWPASSGTSASRWRCARRPTCRPGRPSRSPSTPSACSPSSGSE